MARFFTETSVLGINEASDYDQLYFDSPFSDNIINKCCKNFCSAPVTNVFTQYVVLVTSSIGETVIQVE